MKIYEELVERGLIAQVTDEEEIRNMVNDGKATFYIGFDFSINKPAAVICHEGKLYYYFWPRDMKEQHL